MKADDARYYFALPRLLSGKRTRTEQNFFEANAAGLLVFAVSYFFAQEMLLRQASALRLILWAIPLAFGVWLGWLLLLYLNALILRALRQFGWLRATPDRHAQSLCIGFWMTLCSSYLLAGGTWRAWIGFLWIVALALNLFAALFLREDGNGDRSTTA